MIRKSVLFILLVFLLSLVIPAPVNAEPTHAPNSLAHKTESVFWSNVVPAEEGVSILTFTHGDLYMERQADKTKCTVTPILVYWQGELVGDLRCEKFVWRRGGEWVAYVINLYGDLPPEQQ